MKQLLFDLWSCQPNEKVKFHGGGEYIKSVFKRLVELNVGKCCLTVFFNKGLFIDDWIKQLIVVKSIRVLPVKEMKDVQDILKNNKFDVFYSGIPYAYGCLDIPSETFFCGTIHGLRLVELPCDKYAFKYKEGLDSLKLLIKNQMVQFFRKKYVEQLHQCLKKLDAVICVSNHTQFAIKNFYPLLKKDVYTFYTPQKIANAERREKSNVYGKYILLISCDRFEKNSYRAMEAVDNMFSRGLLSDYKVVTTGNLPRKIKQSVRNEERFVHFGYVSPERLEGLYADCDFFLYPTLNEGFGMPPLEAMKYGKTCVVSGVCSLPEVCGDAVYYCNPYDISEIQNRILMASEHKINKELIGLHIRGIVEKQNKDLDGMCECLLKMGK